MDPKPDSESIRITDFEIGELDDAWHNRGAMPDYFDMLARRFVGPLIKRLRRAESDLAVFIQPGEPDRAGDNL